MAQTDAAPHIRRAVAGDAPACAQIVHSWLGTTPWIETKPSLDDLTAALGAGIPMYQIWVCGDPVAGYLSYDPDERLIRGFYTAAPGSGTGKALLNHIKTDKPDLQLWTHATNIRAHKFYAREGFTFTGKTRPGDDGPDELQMHWRREGTT